MEAQGISYPPIIERIEQVRKGLEWDKALFCRSMRYGRPAYQTHTGQRQAKPSLALVMLVVDRYKPANLTRAAFTDWILHGDGDAPTLTREDRIGKLEERTDILEKHVHRMLFKEDGGPPANAASVEARPLSRYIGEDEKHA